MRRSSSVGELGDFLRRRRENQAHCRFDVESLGGSRDASLGDSSKREALEVLIGEKWRMTGPCRGGKWDIKVRSGFLS